MKLTWIILALCLAHTLALPADIFVVDAVAEEPIFDHASPKSEISTSNPEQSQIPSQSDEIAPTSPLSVTGPPRGPAGLRPVARPGQTRRQQPQKSAVEAIPADVKQEANIEAPVRKMPKIAPMRSQSGTGEEDNSTTGGRKSDAGLHEFLKRRRQERLLATTEPDPLAILKGKEEVEAAAPAESTKSGGKSFGSSRRSSTSNRKMDTTTTTTTTTPKPSRNGASGSRFNSGRKSSRGATNEVPPKEVVEVSTEPTSKARFVPKRFSRKN